ncbi:CIA30 family protein [Colwelliaceae bacterium BS250]
MKLINTILFSTLLCISICSYSADSAYTDISRDKKTINVITESEQIVMIDFRRPKEVDNWRVTNDGVMGGKSLGYMLFKEDHGVFTGDISLDNNGGFSSVYRSIEQLTSDIDAITLDIQGDGLTYQLRTVVNIDGYRLTYKHEFNTTAGQRQRLQFSLADFQATFRGRLISNAPTLKAEDIVEAGFLMTNKVAGKFYLSVYSITFK